MKTAKKPYYFRIHVFGIELLGIYLNVPTENGKTLFGMRIMDNLIFGVCKNEVHYFLDFSCLIWPNTSGEVK